MGETPPIPNDQEPDEPSPVGPDAADPAPGIAEELERLTDDDLRLVEALVVATLEEKATKRERHSSGSVIDETAEPSEQLEIEEVASGLRRFLGYLDFGPKDPQSDPLHIRSLEVAKSVTPKVKAILQRLRAAISDEDKQQIYEEAEEEMANGLLEYSGTPDLGFGENSNRELWQRAREHSKGIVLIVAGVGAAAVAAVAHKKRHDKD